MTYFVFPTFACVCRSSRTSSFFLLPCCFHDFQGMVGLCCLFSYMYPSQALVWTACLVVCVTHCKRPDIGKAYTLRHICDLVAGAVWHYTAVVAFAFVHSYLFMTCAGCTHVHDGTHYMYTITHHMYSTEVVPIRRP